MTLEDAARRAALELAGKQLSEAALAAAAAKLESTMSEVQAQEIRDAMAALARSDQFHRDLLVLGPRLVGLIAAVVP